VVPNTSGFTFFVSGGYAMGINPPITAEKLAEGVLNCLEGISNNNNNNFRKYIPHTWDRVAIELEQLYRQVIL
jgi:hypothetical protein